MRDTRLAFFIFFLFLFSVSVLTPQTKSSVTLSGSVTDAATNSPLEDVNVFIANTMLGSATRSDGRFEIKNVPLGRYDLVVSRIGYKTQKLRLRLTEFRERTFNFKLTPEVLTLPAIEVSAKVDKKWRKNYEKFTRFFLGTSPNASKCKIFNPEVLDFKEESKSQPFTVTAKAPLEIENKALGYRLYFVLEKFQSKKDEIRYLGAVRFEELTPKMTKEKKTWEKNRLEAYRGSMRHFLAALNANRFREAGFLAELVLDMYQEKFSPNRAEIERHALLSSGELPNEKVLNFKDFIEVIYTEMEDPEYIDYRISRDLALGLMKPETHVEAERPRQQKSWISLNRVDVIMDTLGYIPDPLSIKTYGYWAWKRVADMLPWDYRPSVPLSSKKRGAIVHKDYYQEGKQKLEAGDWEKALEIWSEGKRNLADEGKADPRIGIAFIELVTEKQAPLYYEKATDFYYWGFSTSAPAKYKKVVEGEINRMAPLIDEEEFKAWEKDLSKTRPALLAKIKTFWLERDPNPTTTLNERLLEHWERVAYARKNFNKAKNTVYGTDDRGLIFVKYGEPDQKRELTLGDNPAEINHIAGVYGIPSTRYTDFRNGVERFLTYPECEVWSYRSLSSEEPVIFVFGPRDGRGTFGLRDGVEEFIPSGAFSRSSARYTAGVIPGAVIQMMFYNRLTSFDLSFADRLNELDRHLYRLGERSPNAANPFTNSQAAKSLRNDYKSRDKYNPVRKYAPKEQFDPERFVTPIQLTSARARFLDQDNNPILVFVAFAFPPQSVIPNPVEVIKNGFQPDSSLAFSLTLRDAKMNVTERFVAKPIANFDNTAIFRIRHRTDQEHYTLAAAARNPKFDYKNSPNVGKIFFEKIEPLNSESKKLEVSDLVIGVAAPEDVDSELLPFPVVQTDKIWKEDVLKVYLEVYHLKLSKDGLGKFSLDSRIIRLEKKGEKFERRELVATSFDFDSNRATAKEDFGISIANYKPGNYELEVEIVDKVAGKKKKRIAPFEIKEIDTKSMK